MKVSDKSVSQTQTGGTQQTKATKKAATPSSLFSATPSKAEGPESSGNASAKVQLSERVQDMKKIKEQVNKTPDVDEAKVAKFKSMIAKGEYKVDAKAIADKMVDEYAYGSVLGEEKE